jgi:GGDEF domain-containing protein
VLTDSLTGLADRRAAEERLRSVNGLARVGTGPVSLILADLDGFAEVNGRCGYAVGGRLLQAVAGLLHESCRTADTVARLEAARRSCCPARHQAGRGLVRGRAGPPPHHHHRRLPRPRRPRLTASFGVAEHRIPDAWRDLLDRAEAALNRAKRAGRNRCEVA